MKENDDKLLPPPRAELRRAELSEANELDYVRAGSCDKRSAATTGSRESNSKTADLGHIEWVKGNKDNNLKPSARGARKELYAFTLSEVLITLVIIGIIAAITVPNVVRKTQEQEFRSGLKKAVTALNQAIMLEYAQTGRTLSDFANPADLIENLFKKRMAVIQGPTTMEINNTDESKQIVCSKPQSLFTTNDGMTYCVYSHVHTLYDGVTPGGCDEEGTVRCGYILVDVNGPKKPNTLTISNERPKDIFLLMTLNRRIIAYGAGTTAILYDKTVNK